MTKLILTFFFAGFFVCAVSAQKGMGKGKKNGNKQHSEQFKPSSESKEKAKEQLNKKIQSFVASLDNDDFQKEIIKQRLESYFVKFNKKFTNNNTNRNTLVIESDNLKEKNKSLYNTHFKDVTDITSEEIQIKIQEFVKQNNSKYKAKNKSAGKKQNKK